MSHFARGMRGTRSLRHVLGIAGPRDPQALDLVRALRAASSEFAELWERHDVAVRRTDRTRIVHPTVGVVDIDCEVLATARHPFVG